MIKLSPLEHFVKKYLKGIKKSGNIREILPFIEKAITLIKFKLGDPCCTNPDATTSYTRRDNDFTLTVKYLLKKIHGPSTKKILNRVIRILEVFAGACCVTPPTEITVVVNWDNGNSETFPISFIGQNGEGTFTSDPGTTYTFTLPYGTYIMQVSVPSDFNAGALEVTNSNGDIIINVPDTSMGPITADSAVITPETTYTVTFI